MLAPSWLSCGGALLVFHSPAGSPRASCPTKSRFAIQMYPRKQLILLGSTEHIHHIHTFARRRTHQSYLLVPQDMVEFFLSLSLLFKFAYRLLHQEKNRCLCRHVLLIIIFSSFSVLADLVHPLCSVLGLSVTAQFYLLTHPVYPVCIQTLWVHMLPLHRLSAEFP